MEIGTDANYLLRRIEARLEALQALEARIERQLAAGLEALRQEAIEEARAEELLGVPDLCQLLRCGDATLRNVRRSDPTFPSPIAGGRPLRWRRSEIETWMDGRERGGEAAA